MDVEKIEFRIDIEDFKNKEEVINSIKRILTLIYDKKIINKIDKEVGDNKLIFKKKKITLIISKINKEELPF